MLAMPWQGSLARLPGVEFTINTRSAVPTYRQLADQLRAAIESGEIAPGDFLPSIHELMTKTGLAQATVQKARDVLRAEGLVETSPGRGMYVLPKG
jgi:DNA-binding GntR family transcriptional regulator